jgi:hypothetical protein
MNTDQQPIESTLSHMGARPLRTDVRERIRARVFDADGHPRTLSPIRTSDVPVRSPISIFGNLTGATIALFLVFSSIGGVPLAYLAEQGQLAVVTRADHRSAIALDYLEIATDRATRSGGTAAYDDLERAIVESTIELDQLKLMGEPGRYTMEECRALYARFDDQLDELESAADAARDPRLSGAVRAALGELDTRVALYGPRAESTNE